MKGSNLYGILKAADILNYGRMKNSQMYFLRTVIGIAMNILIITDFQNYSKIPGLKQKHCLQINHKPGAYLKKLWLTNYKLASILDWIDINCSSLNFSLGCVKLRSFAVLIGSKCICA